MKLKLILLGSLSPLIGLLIFFHKKKKFTSFFFKKKKKKIFSLFLNKEKNYTI